MAQKSFKRNRVEQAFDDFMHNSGAVMYDRDVRGLIEYLNTEYGFTNITPLIGQICHVFMIATDAQNKQTRRLFIKAGHHHGIYENEFLMNQELYDLDPDHFLAPLYYHDYDKYNFFANEYVSANTLKTVISRAEINNQQRADLIWDLYKIFVALRKSDVVHRDIRPDNFMVIRDGDAVRMVLIDFQLAVSKSNYQELEYMRANPTRLRKLGGKGYRYRQFVWDDAYSLMRVLEFIGRAASYGTLYDRVHRVIAAHVGAARIKSTIREGAVHRAWRHLRQLFIRK